MSARAIKWLVIAFVWLPISAKGKLAPDFVTNVAGIAVSYRDDSVNFVSGNPISGKNHQVMKTKVTFEMVSWDLATLHVEERDGESLIHFYNGGREDMHVVVVSNTMRMISWTTRTDP